jgi:putative CocE/NonD family hydrolase
MEIAGAAEGRDCRIFRNVGIVMRDGVCLATDVYLPKSGGPFPVVLVRTAYNRANNFDPFFVERGMVCVTQDCRGRYESEGIFDPFVNEAKDGCDTLEWIGRQSWCNGRVGMYGASYLASTQFYAAIAGAPHLAALNPCFMAGDCWKRAYYCDGAFSLALTWSWLCFETASRVSQAGSMPHLQVAEILKTLPLLSLDEKSGAGPLPSYRKYVQNTSYGPHWAPLRIRDQLDRVNAPTLLVGGWYDNYPAETIANFLRLRETAASSGVRDSHRLLIGPWTHGFNWNPVLGELNFGPDSITENAASRRWLDCILHGGDSSEFQMAPIRIFVMGLNQWRNESEWPLARARTVSYYLRDSGRLDPEPPKDGETSDSYLYDPENPVPTLGGNHSIGPYNPGLYELVKPGPYDQCSIEERNDVLSYSSNVLSEDVEVTGPVKLLLYASSSAPDTDFVAKLTDVYPDGRSINITEGILRARFRDDVWGTPRLLNPGTVYEFPIDMQATSNLFKKGHRIRITVTSSNFPLWDRNLNTGEDPATDTRSVVAHQTLYHSPGRESRLVLPIVPPAS